MSDGGQIEVVVLIGSVRPGNYTSQAVRLVADELALLGATVTVIDPAQLELRLPGQSGGEAAAAELQRLVGAATGVILATPEYHGSYSSVMKLLIDNLGFPSQLGGKPVALLGVAAGVLGAVKALEHLRSVVSHVGGLVLPGPTSVPGVQGVFDADGHCTDPAVEQRIRQVPRHLMDYIHGFICPKVAMEAMARGQE